MIPTPPELRARIDADIAEETRQAKIHELFRNRTELRKRPPAPRRSIVAGPPVELETPDHDGDGDDGFDRIRAAEGDYHAVCENQAGRIILDEAFADLRERRDRQDADTIEMAEALECRGGRFYYGENDPNRCTLIGLFSEQVRHMPAVRRVNFLPSVAAANRSKMLRDVEYFLGCHPTNSRMYTITNGPRVPIHPITLREDVRDFHRWLSKMAANPTFKLFGVQMQWRATEFGSPDWDPETGQMTLHLHAHCLITEPERMSKKRRAKLRKKLWKVFRVHWDDAGTIENAREFVKYPVKGEDLEKIVREGGPGVLRDFYDAIKGLHITQPMGRFRSYRSKRRAKARRITAFHRGDGRTLEETGDWNAGKRPLAVRNKRREEYRKRCELEAQKGWHGIDSSEADRIAGEDEGNRAIPVENGRAGPRIANRVIARLAPAPYFGPVLEPAVTVWGFDGNMEAVLAQPKVRAIIERHRAAWQAAQDARALIRACASGADARGLAEFTKVKQLSGVSGDLLPAGAAGPPDWPPDPPVLAGIEARN